jgi:hypothetical protein
VLAWQIPDVLDLQPLAQLAEPGQALAALLVVVGGVSQIAGEDDEIRLVGHGVHCRDGLGQCAGEVRVDGGIAESPVRVG